MIDQCTPPTPLSANSQPRARPHFTGVESSSSFLQDHDQEAAAAAAATAAAAAAAAAAATTRITCSYRSSPCLPSRRSRDRDRCDFNDSDPSSTTEDCHQNENMIPGTTCTTFPTHAPTPPSPLRRAPRIIIIDAENAQCGHFFRYR